MFLITNASDNSVIDWAEKEAYTEAGYPLIEDKNISYVDWMVTTNIVDYVPSYVTPWKYCYEPETGFYENPNYVEPNKYGLPDDLVEQIKNDAITEIEEAVTNGTDE